MEGHIGRTVDSGSISYWKDILEGQWTVDQYHIGRTVDGKWSISEAHLSRYVIATVKFERLHYAYGYGYTVTPRHR